MQLVKQKLSTDCGIAAVAIALEREYAEVTAKMPQDLLAKIRDTSKGMENDDIRAVIESMGLVYDQDFTKRTYSPHWGTVGACKNLLWGRRAIIEAWSNNDQGCGHYLVYDGTKGDDVVLDPSTRVTYEKWQDVEPKVMWLFSESGVQKARLPKMVTNFLGWKLPSTFFPDGYVSFDRTRANWNMPGYWPSGTNLLNAVEAKQMLQHVLGE